MNKLCHIYACELGEGELQDRQLGRLRTQYSHAPYNDVLVNGEGGIPYSLGVDQAIPSMFV